MPRPPIQHHRFFLEIEAHTQDFLSDMMDKFIAAKAARAIGHAASGALSNPLLAPALLAAILGLTGGIVGVDVITSFTNVMTSIQNAFNAEDEVAAQAAGNDVIFNMKDFLHVISLGAIPKL